MAFLPVKSEKEFKVIARVDDALDLDTEAYGSYLEDLDESKLTFLEDKEPTRFVFKRYLSWKEQQVIKNKQLRMEDKGRFSIQMAFTMEEVRLSLVGIENPESLPSDQHLKFKRDGAGGASEDFMEMLANAGVVDDFYTALINVRQPNGEDVKKK